jgi:hypothetical protein
MGGKRTLPAERDVRYTSCLPCASFYLSHERLQRCIKSRIAEDEIVKGSHSASGLRDRRNEGI